MKITFYSTNSNYYKSTLGQTKLPSIREELEGFIGSHTVNLVFTIPSFFLVDMEEDKIIKNPKVNYYIVEDDITDIVETIKKTECDIAISLTNWVNPFDWLPIKDSLIAEELMKIGIRAVAHPAETSLTCFDKERMHVFFINNNIPHAKGLYVHHELFYAERGRREIKTNVYKEYVFKRLEDLKLPVVVKDTMGLSSYGMDVCKTYKEAVHVLTSKKNNGDRLVEEFLEGLSFGIEIYGHKGHYAFSPLLINSVNQFGLTSPKQNVKIGPVTNPRFKLEELYQILIKLSEALDLKGIAQVDLLFSNDKWYVIEVNTRVSGMTETITTSLGVSLYELLLRAATGDYENGEVLEGKFVMNMKFPILHRDTMERLLKKSYIKHVNTIENKEAKQLREAGYTEIVFGGTDTLRELEDLLEELNTEEKDIMEEVFYHNAKALIEYIR